MCSDHYSRRKGFILYHFYDESFLFLPRLSHEFYQINMQPRCTRTLQADRLKDISLILNLNLLLTTGLIQGIITMITNYKYNYRLAKSNKQRIIRHCFKSHNI
jgi:hypothetical protein